MKNVTKPAHILGLYHLRTQRGKGEKQKVLLAMNSSCVFIISNETNTILVWEFETANLTEHVY